MAVRPGQILIAQAAGAFGVRGDLRITPYTDDPAAVLRYRVLKREDGTAVLTLTEGRVANGTLIARAREVSTREQAQALRGLRLYIDRADLPEPGEDEFYIVDLIGLAVRSPEGQALGAVKAVHNFGAGDLLEIAPANGEPSWLAPFTLAVVPQVRLVEGEITVSKPPEVEAKAD